MSCFGISISQEEKAKRARFLAKCKKRRDEFRGKMQDAETIVLAAAEREKKQNFTKSLGLLKHAMKLDEQPNNLAAIIRVHYKMRQYDKVCEVIHFFI